jgi:hypothetical protein
MNTLPPNFPVTTFRVLEICAFVGPTLYTGFCWATGRTPDGMVACLLLPMTWFVGVCKFEEWVRSRRRLKK